MGSPEDRWEREDRIDHGLRVEQWGATRDLPVRAFRVAFTTSQEHQVGEMARRQGLGAMIVLARVDVLHLLRRPSRGG